MDQSIDLMDPAAWDDSALIDSWDMALAEYKRYHSIHARGENVKDIIKNAEVEAGLKNMPLDDELPPMNNYKQDDQDVKEAVKDRNTSEQPPDTAQAPTNVSVELPQALLATGGQSCDLNFEIPDEQLKNLMMAWYYAGYHTGLVEGQRKAQEAILAETTKS
ncbi:hypothetical protein EJ05DRAFT_484535 [Pseudovirgaria hyperparasitica]|uniref:Survival Motor Neuron Gemin2-binding domain-containing protein n=1 Tax=Pseudovirgaria hyperparasitica TaxID=470096 RepID=A0A6A6WAK0_9PEZI|nr:uncharacterized protein EJ05DRAFT_484535 [Pseudovirgaria hyperparasitica]KAF2759595.1 hypothetical protein EJ05DRAFT_484535 [Pseudovirgaria hyperparasitica]